MGDGMCLQMVDEHRNGKQLMGERRANEITLKWILKEAWRCRLESSDSLHRPITSYREYGNELLGSTMWM